MKAITSAITTVALLGLVALGLVRLSLLWQSVPQAVKRVEAQAELNRPAKISVTVITDRLCTSCTSPQPFVQALLKQRVSLISTRRLDAASEDGKRYLTEQKVERVPAVLVEGELTNSPELGSFLAQAGKVDGGRFTYFASAPYREVASGQVRGEFSTTYVAEPRCSSCYDVTRNAIALKNLGMTVNNDTVVATSSPAGSELMRRYRLRYLPTIVLTGDLEAYTALQSVWPTVGSREPDGAYILRDGVKLMGTYYDLILKRAVTPPTNPS